MRLMIFPPSQNLGDMFVDTWQLLKKKYIAFGSIALVVRGIILSATWVMQSYFPSFFSLISSSEFAVGPTPLQIQLFLQELLAQKQILILFLLVAIGCGLLIQILITTMSRDDGGYIEKIKNRFFPLFFTYMIGGILKIILFVLGIIPGIIFSVYRTFATTISILSPHRGREALKKSFALVKEKRWQTLFTMVVIGVSLSFFQSLLSAVVLFLGKGFLTSSQLDAVSLLVWSTFFVIEMVLYTVWYMLFISLSQQTKISQNI